jgi:hypothetical protein
VSREVKGQNFQDKEVYGYTKSGIVLNLFIISYALETDVYRLD